AMAKRWLARQPTGSACRAPCAAHGRLVSHCGNVHQEAMPERRGSTVIENVQPQLDGGRFPVKRVAGEPVRITADIFKEGHDDLAAVVRWRQLTPQATEAREEPMRFVGNDVWEAERPFTGHGLYALSIEACPDSFRTWVHELKRKVDVGRDVSSELLEGSAL